MKKALIMELERSDVDHDEYRKLRLGNKTMKIEKVIMSTNDLPTYIEFWPYISQAWKKLLGNNVEIVLGYVTDKSQEEISRLDIYGKVIHFKRRYDIPDSNHAKVVRTLIACRYSNEYCLLSDIDMLPLNADYFIKNSKYVNDNNIVIYSSDQSGIQAKYPICYLLAKGKVFKEIINPDNLDENQLLTSWFNMKIYGEDEAINNNRFSDESLYRIFFERWGVLDRNKHRTVFLKRKWSKNIARHRIDRAKWHINLKKLRKGKYIDSHLVRPLHDHQQDLKPLFDYLGIKDQSSMQTFETHLPVLERVFKEFKIDTVLEFGMGFVSTPFFLKKAKKIISIEMQSNEWYLKLIDRCFDADKFYPLQLLGPQKAIDFVGLIDKKFDLVFVDGHGDSRWAAINVSFDKTNLIIVHDTETESYNWDRVKMPNNWVWIDIKEYSSWTSVLTNNKKMVKYLEGSIDNRLLSKRL